MIKKIALAAIFILFLNGCNYEPIYSLKNEKFSIGNLQSTGDKKINKLLTKKLEIYKNNDSNKIKYNLNITSEIIKSTASKDKKGNPTTFTLTLTIRIEVKNSMGEKKSKIFVENTSYDNDNNKFNLRKYENSIKNNMIETINENIILYLQDLN
tara:strand:+ start:27 stop:488 length:462 start_codon:yes stop_codon:yes gene_type:complete